jgi:hypothetical protein
MGLNLHQAGTAEQVQHCRTLIMMVLEEEQSAGGQRSGRTGHHPPNLTQTIFTTIQGLPWLVPADDGIQAGDSGGGDVGRIGNDEGEAAPLGANGIPPVTPPELHPALEPPLPEIESSHPQGFPTPVDGHPLAIRKGLGEGKGKTSGTRTEIRPERWGSRRGCAAPVEGDFHQELRLRAGDQDGGSDPEQQISPGTEPCQVLKRCVRRKMASPETLQVTQVSSQAQAEAWSKPKRLELGPGESTDQIEQPVEFLSGTAERKHPATPAKDLLAGDLLL